MSSHLGARLQTRRLINIDEVAAELGRDADELEDTLNDWSLRRLVTFHSTRRFWRIALNETALDAHAFAEVTDRWRSLQQQRLRDMEAYAKTSGCRRASISAVFGDSDETCADRPGALPCDLCSSDRPLWEGLGSFSAPDPEQLIDIELVVLQAVRWTCQYEGGRYGEASLRLALLGEESFGSGARISAGLLSMPQFGALKNLRNRESRLDQAIDELLNNQRIRSEEVEGSSGNSYTALTITQIGRAVLGGGGA